MSEWTQTAMNRRLVRYADMIPCRTAFVDTRTPGSTDKENFTIIGPGVSESADQHVHISERHGFNIGAARQPFGCVNSQHSHDTAEVFIVHSGRWKLVFGPNREDGELEIGPGDVVSVPIHMFRGFEKIDEGLGFLFTVLGEDDPGQVTWAPAVLEAAADYGMRLAKGGRLIDASAGGYALKEVELESGLDEDGLKALKTPPMARMVECFVSGRSLMANPRSALSGRGVREAGVIGANPTRDGFDAGPITGWWPHGFNLRRLEMESGSYVPLHARREAEVILMQEGMLEVSWSEGDLMLGPGDVLSVPVGLQHAFRNTASTTVSAFLVRGSDDPGPPIFASSGT